jgi:hypothetical protein
MNGLISSDVEKTQQWLFRIANVEGSPGNIDRISPLFPWKVGDGGSDNAKILYYDEEGKNFQKVRTLRIIPNTTEEQPEGLIVDSYNPTVTFAPLYGTTPIPRQQDGTATSRTFNQGGVVACTTATALTINGLTFTNFVGILAIPPYTNVSADKAFYYLDYGIYQ